jgi:hypothetical protein
VQLLLTQRPNKNFSSGEDFPNTKAISYIDIEHELTAVQPTKAQSAFDPEKSSQ